jgi:hypothetical protein
MKSLFDTCSVVKRSYSKILQSSRNLAVSDFLITVQKVFSPSSQGVYSYFRELNDAFKKWIENYNEVQVERTTL